MVRPLPNCEADPAGPLGGCPGAAHGRAARERKTRVARFSPLGKQKMRAGFFRQVKACCRCRNGYLFEIAAT
jgi:hypothetical protein